MVPRFFTLTQGEHVCDGGRCSLICVMPTVQKPLWGWGHHSIHLTTTSPGQGHGGLELIPRYIELNPRQDASPSLGICRHTMGKLNTPLSLNAFLWMAPGKQSSQRDPTSVLQGENLKTAYARSRSRMQSLNPGGVR